jgi:hypothetical protein
MKSIRGSLLVYFFFVVVATLGAVSLLAYENTCAILQGWEATRADLLSRQYTVNCENERGKLDAALANNVKALASIATLRPRGVQSYLPVAGLLTNLIEPTGRTFSTALWLSRPESLLYRQLHMGGEEQISFDEEKLHHFIETASDHAGAQLREYFQINRRMSSWRSPSLGELSLPYRANHVQAMKMYDSIKGEFELRPGVRVRRLAIKTPIFSTFRVGGLGLGMSRLNNERP